jgi:hypothetical protein
MKSITDKSHTLAEALLRMRDKTVAAEERGDKTVSIGIEDALNLKDAAFRCNDYARMDNLQDGAFNRGVQRQRISSLQSAAKWATERGHNEFAEYLTGLAGEWTKRGEKV